MNLHLVAIATAVVLTSGIGAANGAEYRGIQKTLSKSGVPTIGKRLVLTHTQRRTAWRAISRHGSIQITPINFTASVGATLPAGLTLRTLPAEAAAHVPALRPYRYTLLQNELLIVNPDDKKIVGVIYRNT